MRVWSKVEIYAILHPSNIVVFVATVILSRVKGAYDATALTVRLIKSPCGLISVQIGIFVFNRLLVGFTFLMGIGVLISELA